MWALCVGALLVAPLVSLVLHQNGVTGRAPRLTLQVAGVCAYVGVARVLRGPERRHELRHGTFHKLSFWTGLGACLALGLVQGVLILAVIGVLGG